MSDIRTWVVRAGRDASHIEDFRSNSVVAIGWFEVGALAPFPDDDQLDALFAQTYPSAKVGARRVWFAQVRRFAKEVKVGDRVATYDPNSRTYLLGTIAGDVRWRDGVLARYRPVQWTHHALRDVLSLDTRNALGSIATLFLASQEASEELWANAVPQEVPLDQAPPPTAAKVASGRDSAAEAILRDEVIEKSQQFIEDRIAELDWSEMQELVAGLLRAMGYRTQVSADGSDRGVDIFASPDGLGLQEPRIFVEVKHRSATMGADELRAFLGGRRPGDRCLYVSTGGFTKDARYEADRSNVPLTLITLPRLRELLVQHYEKLDPATRALVPLQSLYWPID